MRTSAPNGYIQYVWDQNADVFDHTQLAANFDSIDNQLAQPRTTNAITQVATLPVGLNNTTDRGKIYFLTATDQGYPALSIVRWSGSAWADVRSVELMSALPTLNNFDGRMVLLSTAASGFAAWTLVRYQGGSWFVVNQGIEIASAVPVSNLFAGRVVILSAASAPYNAYEIIRYDGSAWKLVGPQPVAPGTELAYSSITADTVTANTVTPGDVLTIFGAATYENTKYYLEIFAPKITHSTTGYLFFLLRESGATVGNPIPLPIGTGGTYENCAIKFPFTPTAAAHTYSVNWYVSVAGTATIQTTGLAPAICRIVKA